MFLERLELVDYRNYESLVLEFKKPIVIILGGNGQGKTNILEAIYFLTTNNSFRAQQNREMVFWEKNQSLLKGRVRTQGGEYDIEASIEQGGVGAGRNQQKRKNTNTLSGLSTVVFTPDDLQIIKGSPQKRRRYLDNIISKIKPTFTFTSINYSRVLQQRNALLKYGDNIRQGQLEVWDKKLISLGSKIILERDKISRRIHQKAQKTFMEIMEGRGIRLLEISYSSSIQEREAIEEIEEELARELGEGQEEEKERGLTLVGPHRDDLLLVLNKKEARLFASQGEERAITLALKLSEVEILQEEKGQRPLVLFDDVLSELDEGVKKSLLGRLDGKNQTFITATGSECVPGGLENAQWLYVEEGGVRGGEAPS